MTFIFTPKEFSTIHRMLGLIEGASFDSPQIAEVIGNAVQTIDEILEKSEQKVLIKALKEREMDEKDS